MAGVQLRHILRIGILGRALGVPPDVGEGHDSLGCAGQGGDVFGRVSRGADEPDRGGYLPPLCVAVGPEVAIVDRPVVLVARVGAERGVDRVVRMVMAEDHICDLVGIDTQRLEWVEYERAIPHHARVDDHGRFAVPDQRDSAGHVAAHIPCRQHVDSGVPFSWSFGHGPMLHYARAGVRSSVIARSVNTSGRSISLTMCLTTWTLPLTSQTAMPGESAGMISTAHRGRPSTRPVARASSAFCM